VRNTDTLSPQSLRNRLVGLPTRTKWGIVIGGYVLAFLIATGAVWLHMIASGPESDASSGMYAFAEAVLFLAVSGMIALVPTGLAVVFLGWRRILWSILALVIAATAIVFLMVVR
jgi:hypothetical protein